MINVSRLSLVNRTNIVVPEWVRVTMGFTDQSIVYFVGQELSYYGYEVFVSSIPPSAWGDIWRIEIDFSDSPGLLRGIVELFDKYQIYILEAETIVSKNGLGHSTSFICNCAKYYSEIDGTSKERVERGKSNLFALEAAITNKLIDNLWFDSSLSPRIRVNRLNSYHRMINELSRVHDKYGHYSVTKISNGSLNFPPKFIEKIYLELGLAPRDKLSLSFTCNSKDRTARLLFANPKKNIFNFKVIFKKNDWCLHHVFNIVEKRGYNVLGSKIRQNSTNKIDTLKDTADQYGTMDIVICSKTKAPKDRRKLLQTIFDELHEVSGGSIVGDESFSEFRNPTNDT